MKKLLLTLTITTSIAVQAAKQESVQFTKKIGGVLDNVSQCTQSIKKSIEKNPQVTTKIDETVDSVVAAGKKVVKALEVTPEKEAAIKKSFEDCKEDLEAAYKQSVKPHVDRFLEDVGEILFSDEQKNENIKTVLHEATDRLKEVLKDEKIKQVARKIGGSLKKVGEGLEKVLQEK